MKPTQILWIVSMLAMLGSMLITHPRLSGAVFGFGLMGIIIWCYIGTTSILAAAKK